MSLCVVWKGAELPSGDCHVSAEEASWSAHDWDQLVLVQSGDEADVAFASRSLSRITAVELNGGRVGRLAVAVRGQAMAALPYVEHLVLSAADVMARKGEVVLSTTGAALPSLSERLFELLGKVAAHPKALDARLTTPPPGRGEALPDLPLRSMLGRGLAMSDEFLRSTPWEA